MSDTDRVSRFIQPIGAAPGVPLSRRAFLGWSSAGAAALASAAFPAGASPGLERPQPDRPEWMRAPGRPMSGYGSPSPREAALRRGIQSRYGLTAPASGASTTPLEGLEGTITPSGLHFERHHSGIPDIDAARHSLLVDGAVARPLFFSATDLLRYPLVSRTCFIECSGNSAFNIAPEPLQVPCGALHGLLSCSEWTGVPLALLLEEAGLRSTEGWLVAEGADSSAMNRSIPLSLALEEGMIALFQNGERIRPEQGYPMRLLLPGLEGNVNVKWLRRLEVRAEPAQARDETSKYTDLLPDGRARQFSLEMGVKSLITRPSSGMRLPSSGFYEVSGLAWSGAGRITHVEFSSDGGQTWAPARLDGPTLPKSLTRFRVPWKWQRGQGAVLQSRAMDERGRVQPTRSVWTRRYSPSNTYHYNAIQSWAIGPNGEVTNSHA